MTATFAEAIERDIARDKALAENAKIFSGGEALNQESGDNWTLFHGDSCEVLKGIPDNSIDFGIHSPPFANLYIYSDSEADMGNCATSEEFFVHYRYIIRELYRTTVPGRLVAVHCKDLPKYANRDGTAGLIDFPGQITREFEAEGWSYHSRVTIWKCPVVERERTNPNGLLHKTACRDRSQLRQGCPDYLLMFRKPPVGTLMSDKPVVRDDGKGFAEYVGGDEDPTKDKSSHPSPFARQKQSSDPSIDIWQWFADPVWWDIQQTDVIQGFKDATSEEDERHICPLQLGVIERAVEIWSNPDDVVLSPFAGIGSEGVGALRRGRKFVGCELSERYWKRACVELRKADTAKPAQRKLRFE